MGKEDFLSGFILELRRGTIILCVLSKLRKPAYGYNLIGELAQTGVPIEANTLYPLLRRLESNGLLESAWDTEATKPRKYYSVTALGCDTLDALKTHWQKTVRGVNQLLEDENDEA